jgi:DNA ligase-associated metallophosphoesterase
MLPPPRKCGVRPRYISRVTHRITLAGTTVVLAADRSLYLPDLQTLIVADVHWGKAAAFRALGVPVPHGTTSAGLATLTKALLRTKAAQLIVLGDLWHARAGMAPGTVQTITAWRETWRSLPITLVRGNHDLQAGDPPAALGITCVDAPMSFGPFALCHHPCESDVGYVLAGHVHPVAQLFGRGRQKLTLPCFAFGERSGLLPAFGEFTGGAIIDRREYRDVHVIADDSVVALPSTATVQAP